MNVWTLYAWVWPNCHLHLKHVLYSYTQIWFCKMTDDISRMRTDEHGPRHSIPVINSQVCKIYCHSITEYYGCTIYCNLLAYSTCTEGQWLQFCLFANSFMLSSEKDHTEVSGLLSEGAVTEVVLQSMAWQTIRSCYWSSASEYGMTNHQGSLDWAEE